MKKILPLLICLSFLASAQSPQGRGKVRPPKKAASSVQKKKPSVSPRVRKVAPRTRAAAPQTSSDLRRQLSHALQLSQSGQYQAAATQLFNLARRPELRSDRPQIKYILGLMLEELKLSQVAAFQFVDVIRSNHPRYTKLAIDKLATVADELGDDTLINYAMAKVKVMDVPESSRDMVQFRIGEIRMRARQYQEAIQTFSKIGVGSRYYGQALFQKGLAYLEMSRPREALNVFKTMHSARRNASVTDTNKVAAQLAIARSYYQLKDWDKAIESYSEIPRDHVLWHEALYEQSWAMLRGARFRSVLSNFQSLHSPFYEDDYNPESLILRAIVYLYICKYDEMEKVLGLYEKTYVPARSQISVYLNNNSKPLSYYSEVEKWQKQKALPADERTGLRLPDRALNYISQSGNARRSLNYLKRLENEKKAIEANASLNSTALGRYATKVLNNRIRNTKINIGEFAKVQLANMRNELKDYAEQVSFVRYEMISAKKEVVKKRIQGTDLPESRIDDNRSRQFYVQNGYQYYPFNGEYWLDEVGNYQFLGKSSCE